MKALENISVVFHKNEFVSILGTFGGGKTTLLNTIDGLDHYIVGDLIIDGKSNSLAEIGIPTEIIPWDLYSDPTT